MRFWEEKNEFVPKRWRLSRLDGIAWTKSPEVVKEILSELPPAFEITRIYGIIYHTVLWIWKDYAFNFFFAAKCRSVMKEFRDFSRRKTGTVPSARSVISSTVVVVLLLLLPGLKLKGHIVLGCDWGEQAAVHPLPGQVPHGG